MTEREREQQTTDLIAFWSMMVPLPYRGILTGDGWSWDEERQAYRSATGTWVGGADLDALARNFMTGVEIGLEKEAISLLPNVGEWKPRIKQDATMALFVLGMLALGGESGLDEESRAIIQGEESTDETPGYGIADINMRLDRFADELREGDAGSMKQIVNRAGMYARGGWEIFQECRRLSHERATDAYGRKLFLWERNILDPSCHHCTTHGDIPGCVSVSEAGWQPIGELPRIGFRACAQSCRCRWAYSLFPDDLQSE
jgi:hypothetical protein